MHEVNASPGLYARRLLRVVAEYGQCPNAFTNYQDQHDKVLEALTAMARLLERGQLTLLHSVFVKANARSSCLNPETRRIHEPFRKVLRELKEEASQERNFQVKELAYQLSVINKYLGASPKRTTLLPDRRSVPLREFLHYTVMTTAQPLFSLLEEVHSAKRFAS